VKIKSVKLSLERGATAPNIYVIQYGLAYALLYQEDGSSGPICSAYYGPKEEVRSLKTAWRRWTHSDGLQTAPPEEWTFKWAASSFHKWLVKQK
jgi:hypothetical protein